VPVAAYVPLRHLRGFAPSREPFGRKTAETNGKRYLCYLRGAAPVRDMGNVRDVSAILHLPAAPPIG